MAKNPLKIMDTILRDAHQSQAATRMKIEDMIPILPVLDSIGYWSLECWGGATFDVCMRFLNEDPWERLRTLKKGLPNTKLQMLLRGQNILGYRHYADDVVEAFCKKSIENGIDVATVSGLLGHADVTTTTHFYVHPRDEAMRNAMRGVMPVGAVNFAAG